MQDDTDSDSELGSALSEIASLRAQLFGMGFSPHWHDYMQWTLKVLEEALLATRFVGRKPLEKTVNNDYENRAWQTIEVRTAKSRRVEITIEPDSARDLGERQLVTNSVDEEWTNLLLQKARAEQALQVGHEAYENCLFNCGPAK